MNNNEKCSVGISLNEDCNALTSCHLIDKNPVESLTDSDKVTVSPNQQHIFFFF